MLAVFPVFSIYPHSLFILYIVVCRVSKSLVHRAPKCAYLIIMALGFLSADSESASCSVVSDSLRPHDCSSPGSSVHGILQVRILEWVAIPFSRRSSWPRDRTQVSLHCRQILYCLNHQGSPYNLIGKKENRQVCHKNVWKNWTVITVLRKIEFSEREEGICGKVCFKQPGKTFQRK